MTHTQFEEGLGNEQSARRPILKADPTAEGGTNYLDARVGSYRAEVGFSDFKVDPYAAERLVREIFSSNIQNLRPGDRRTQRMRADVGILVDLRRRGLAVYVDDSGPLLHITAHAAFAHAQGGMHCFSYSYFIGESRFRARRWLHVSPQAIEQCMAAHRTASLDGLRLQLSLLIAGVAPIANLAMARAHARVGIPIQGGIFGGGFAPGVGLSLRDYVTGDCSSLPSTTWQAYHKLFAGLDSTAEDRPGLAITAYRERLLNWLALSPPEIGTFVAAGERNAEALIPGGWKPEEPCRAPTEVEYPPRLRVPREALLSTQ